MVVQIKFVQFLSDYGYFAGLLFTVAEIISYIGNSPVCDCIAIPLLHFIPHIRIFNFFDAVGGGMVGGGGWGFAGMRQTQPMASQTQNYDALFNSLFPINGMVTGEEVMHTCKHTCMHSVFRGVAVYTYVV